MSKKITYIGRRAVGAGQMCYLIAEVGTTCGGDLNKARRLIAAAAEAGMDAVKFQLIDPTQVTDRDATYPVNAQGRTLHLNMREMFEKLRFNRQQWREIAITCQEHGVDFFATVDYLEGVDLLEDIGVAVYKIGAWDITYRQLLEKIGRTGKPMFADLGPATWQQVMDAVDWYRGAGGSAVLFMHDFHTQDEREMNMRAIRKLNDELPWPAGWSSPAMDDELDILAIALDAAYIEKRLILSRDDLVFHAHESLEPEELKAWAARLRHAERALGVGEVRPTSRDLELAGLYFRSLHTTRDLPAGHCLTPDDLDAKRPGTGLPPSELDQLVGRKLKRPLLAETMLSLGDLV
jgi:N,N'-diacetyllegionaminate synthase